MPQYPILATTPPNLPSLPDVGTERERSGPGNVGAVIAVTYRVQKLNLIFIDKCSESGRSEVVVHCVWSTKCLADTASVESE